MNAEEKIIEEIYKEYLNTNEAVSAQRTKDNGILLSKTDVLILMKRVASDRQSYAESIAKERAVEILKWMARYETHDDDSGTDGITLIDGVYYWDGDTDGDAPLSEEKIYEIYTAEDTFLAEKRKGGAE